MLKTVVPVSELKPGMTVLYKNKIYTINKADLIHNDRFSYTHITRVQFEVPLRNSFRLSL